MVYGYRFDRQLKECGSELIVNRNSEYTNGSHERTQTMQCYKLTSNLAF